jgi:hypothetical protein
MWCEKLHKTIQKTVELTQKRRQNLQSNFERYFILELIDRAFLLLLL